MKKKGHSAAFKFKVALEAVKGEKTAAELCKEYGIFSSQIFKWRKALIEQGASVFEGSKDRTIVSSRYRRVNEILGITRCWVEGLIVRRLNGQGKASRIFC